MFKIVCERGRKRDNKSVRLYVCVSELNERGSVDTVELLDIDNSPSSLVLLGMGHLDRMTDRRTVCVCVCVCAQLTQCTIVMGVVSSRAVMVVTASAAILIRSTGLLCRSVVGRSSN